MSEQVIPGRGPKIIRTVAIDGTPLSYQQLTVSTAAVALTVPQDAVSALITVQDAAIRWRDDGTDPTSTVGMPLWNGSSMVITTREALTRFKAIRDSVESTDAILNISYYFKP